MYLLYYRHTVQTKGYLLAGDLGIARERVLTKASLSAQDCLFMGKHCFNSGSLARSLEWFEEAWVMAGSERNQSLRQDQVQQFLDHASKAHDVKVLNGERGPELFPKPVYEESPFDQRTKLVQETKQRFQKNITTLGTAFFYGFTLGQKSAICPKNRVLISNF